MQQTFANLPEPIEQTIATILHNHQSQSWITRAKDLHDRYMLANSDQALIHDFTDVLAYLAMRAPATYAQISSALGAISELLPAWQPKTMLDIGTGPGAAVWAGASCFPKLQQITALDQNSDFLQLGKQIITDSGLSIPVKWKQQQLDYGLTENTSYDVIVIANVLNELPRKQSEKIVGHTWNLCNGVLLIVEPGTPNGSTIITSIAKNFRETKTVLAPYIDTAIVDTGDYWLHFPQKFQRPEFQRRVRQSMRESSLMASDWEEAKYSYVALSKIQPEKHPWGRVVGPTIKQKGFLELPVLTKETLANVKVMKRHKQQYTFAKNVRWGDIIMDQNDVIISEKTSTATTK